MINTPCYDGSGNALACSREDEEEFYNMLIAELQKVKLMGNLNEFLD